jgi:hypothetical protein
VLWNIGLRRKTDCNRYRGIATKPLFLFAATAYERFNMAFADQP